MLVHKTTKVYKKYRTIRFTDSEGGVGSDMLVDYYKPMMTFTQIGYELGVSSQRANQLYQQAMNKIEVLIDIDEVATANDDKDIMGGAERHYSKMAV